MFPSAETISHHGTIFRDFEHTEKKRSGRARSIESIYNFLTKPLSIRIWYWLKKQDISLQIYRWTIILRLLAFKRVTKKKGLTKVNATVFGVVQLDITRASCLRVSVEAEETDASRAVIKSAATPTILNWEGDQTRRAMLNANFNNVSFI